MNIITIDVETYYSKKDYSLSKSSTEAYINDSRFEVIGLAIKVNDGETKWYSGSYESTKLWLEQFDWKGSLVLAHNTLFDGAILSWRFGINPAGWLDTLSMARALHGVDAGGSLKALAERYGVGVKGTEVDDADGLHRWDFTPEQLHKYSQYCINDVDLTYALFLKMGTGFPQRELKLIDATLRCYINPILEINPWILEAHLGELRVQKETLLASVNKDPKALHSNKQFAAILESLGVEVPMKISKTTGKPTYALAKTDEGLKALLEHENPEVQALVAARLGTKSTIEETRTERFIDIAKRNNNQLPIALKYYGARTGRWSALDKQNLQNIPRKSTMKQAIHAPDGYVMVGVDLSNIELRGGLWIAGQLDKLELLGGGHDLYCDFAAEVRGLDYSVVRGGYEADDPEQTANRQLGKVGQLSLIYGTGSAKLKDTVRIQANQKITIDLAESMKENYRSTYTDVVNAWREGTDVLKAIMNDEYMEYGNEGIVKVHGRKGIYLPSGLYMAYPELQEYQDDETGRTKWKYKIRNGWEDIYGSKVFQGVTQAVARCVMGEAWLRIQKRYPLAMSIHDAAYFVAPESEAAEALEYAISCMRVTPKWMPGIPLDAEGKYGKTWKDC